MIFHPILDPAFKAYNARQPRDDHGKWSDGAGGISVGHAVHVAKHEGIGEEHHAGIREGIASGKLDTREKVLAHIDAIHAANRGMATEPHATAMRRYEVSESNRLQVEIGQPGDTDYHNPYQVADLRPKIHSFAVVDKTSTPIYGPPITSENGGFSRSTVGVEEKESKRIYEARHWENHGMERLYIHNENGAAVGHFDLQSRKAKSNGKLKDKEFSRVASEVEKFADLHYANSKKSMFDDTLIAFGEGIKSVEETEDSYKFGAFLVVFDSPDISNYRDSFTKSTDFGFEDGDTRPILYNHGLDGTFGKTTIGKARLYLKDAGVWMTGEIKKRHDYLEKHIERVGEGLRATVRHRGIEAPMFGASSGSASHSVVREIKGAGHEIKQWFLAEASITPTPCEPQTACMSLKSLVEIEAAETGADDEFKRYDPRQTRDDAGRWASGGEGGGFTANHAIAIMKAEGINDPAKHEEVARAISVGIHREPEHVLRHIDRIHFAIGKGVSMDGGVAQRAAAAAGVAARAQQAEAESATHTELVNALANVHATLAKARGAHARIMEARAAALNVGRRASKSDDEFSDFLDEAESELAEMKVARGWQTQPRDDGGKWTDGAGNLSAAHVSTVMHSEGISEGHHHAAIQNAIRQGQLKTRADVLARIDAIHADKGESATLKPSHEMTSDEFISALPEIRNRNNQSYIARLNSEIGDKTPEKYNDNGVVRYRSYEDSLLGDKIKKRDAAKLNGEIDFRVQKAAIPSAMNQHKYHVIQAAKKGEQIPESVLDEYPEARAITAPHTMSKTAFEKIRSESQDVFTHFSVGNTDSDGFKRATPFKTKREALEFLGRHPESEKVKAEVISHGEKGGKNFYVVATHDYLAQKLASNDRKSLQAFLEPDEIKSGRVIFDDDDSDGPEEETISGATSYPFEMGRYVASQLAKSGLN